MGAGSILVGAGDFLSDKEEGVLSSFVIFKGVALKCLNGTKA